MWRQEETSGTILDRWQCFFLQYVRPFMWFALCTTFASYLSHCFQQSWNRSALSTVHYELMLLTRNLEVRMEAMEGNTKKIVLLLKELADRVQRETGCCKEDHMLSVQNMIRDAISRYDADKTGMTDFAMDSLGGCIVSIRDTRPYKEGGPKVSILGMPIISVATDPKVIIQAGILPGECWAFVGQKGRAVIELVTSVVTTNVTIEHIPKALSPTGDISSAVKRFSVWGLSTLHDKSPICLGQFQYDAEGLPVQTFALKNGVGRAYKMVELVVESNQGNSEFTCVYRVRIHGILPEHVLD